MNQLDEWVGQVRAELGLDSIDTGLVLDLARDVAHNVLRPAAPVSAYLLGLAVGRGADPVHAAAVITRLAEEWAAAQPSKDAADARAAAQPSTRAADAPGRDHSTEG